MQAVVYSLIFAVAVVSSEIGARGRQVPREPSPCAICVVLQHLKDYIGVRQASKVAGCQMPFFSPCWARTEEERLGLEV